MALPTTPGYRLLSEAIKAGCRLAISCFREDMNDGPGGVAPTANASDRAAFPAAFRPPKLGKLTRLFAAAFQGTQTENAGSPGLKAQNAVPVEIVRPGFVQIVRRKCTPVAAQLVDRWLAGVGAGDACQYGGPAVRPSEDCSARSR